MIFGRFTERAQKVLALSQEEAVRLQHSNIGTEHILLGLIREGDGIAAKALQQLGLEATKIQEEVEKLIGVDRKSTRLNSSHVAISYAVFCLKKKKKNTELNIRYNVRSYC